MWTTVETFIFQHDLRMVVLAAVVCAISSFSAITLLSHARKTSGTLQKAWLAIAAVSTGFGVWATHFIAMLAFNPGVAFGFDLPLTLLSLAISVSVTGGGLWFAAIGSKTSDTLLGGAIVGLGISAMHYTGMASLIIGGTIQWEPATTAASVLFGIGFGALALYVGLSGEAVKTKIAGAAIQTLAIVLMHFTGMGAAGFENCFAIIESISGTAAILLPATVAGVSLLILMAALTGVYLEVRDRRRDEREGERMRDLANAAVEGLVVCDGDEIVTGNESFLDLVEMASHNLVGAKLSQFVDAEFIQRLRTYPNTPVEFDLGARGKSVPVEAILRYVEFAGRPQIAIAFRDLRDRRQAEQYIRFMAHHDGLTGLPNRTSFNEKLQGEIAKARRYNTKLAVLALDLDRFKEVNDLFGHAAGDTMLKKVGEVLASCMEGEQYAARLSGDEFAIVLPDICEASAAGAVASRIFEKMSSTNREAEDGTHMAASLGIAIYPDNSDDQTSLLNHADTALYRAKQEGRGTYCFFQDEMGVRVRARRLLEHDLRVAIDNEQLRLVYQPQVKVQSGEVTGFEALVRWDHPQRGTVSPADFIPLAEESRLILKIGDWVMRNACAEAASWANPLSVAVNVSAVQLHHHDFAENLQKVLHETGLPPKRLEIEITETALVKDMARAIATLAQVKALGVRIAMDDFGTGYSSLSNLRSFEFDKIKVDQSFIRSVDHSDQSAAIVRAVLGLGRGLNLPVLAEGVERMEELGFLEGEVCAEAQGYLVSRPVGIEEFDAYTSGRERNWQKPGTVIDLKKTGSDG